MSCVLVLCYVDVVLAGDAVTTSVPVMMGRELRVEARGRVCYVTFQGKAPPSCSTDRQIDRQT